MDSHKRTVVLCLALHAGLILTHVALLIVYLHHYERAIVTEFNSFSSNWLPLIVTTIAQVIGTLYLAVLVLVTQRLALSKDMHTRQTLTAIHDKSSAWLGLGSAAFSAWKQTRLRAAPWGVLCITLYLLGVFTLHVTIPGLFHIVPFNATVPSVQRTDLANVSYTFNQPVSYDILSVYDQFPTLGLLDKMVYDVIPALPSGQGTTTVNASLYEVDCTALPNASQIFGNPSGAAGQNPEFVFALDGDNRTLLRFDLPYNASIYTTGQLSTVQQGEYCATQEENCSTPFIVAATVPIVDSTGSLSPNPWKPIHPAIIQDAVAPSPPLPGTTSFITLGKTALITQVQLLACTASIKDMKIDVSAETQRPMSTPQRPLNVVWKNYSLPKTEYIEPRLRAAQSAPASSPASGHRRSISVSYALDVVNSSTSSSPVGGSFQLPPVGGVPTNQTQSSTFTLLPTAFDVFVQEDLGILSRNVPNVTLADLNFSLGKALAAVYWYGKTVNYSSDHAWNSATSQHTALVSQPIPAYGEAVIMVADVRMHLNLSLAPVVVGLGMSILLLLLSGALIRFAEAGKTHACHAVFDSTGVLQLAWLFGDEPDLLRIRRPEVEALRGAGMFEVELTKRAHEKVKWAFESESSVALTGSATNLIAKEKAPQYATVRLGLIPSVPLLYM